MHCLEFPHCWTQLLASLVGMGAGSLWGVDPDAQPKREPGEGLSQGASSHYFLGLHFAPLFMEGHFQIYHVRKGGLDCWD